MAYKRCSRFSLSCINNDNKFSVFNPHTEKPVNIKNRKIIGVFIDPAIKTCAIRVAKYDIDTKKVKTLLQELFDFRTIENEYATGTSYYSNCINLLDNYLKYFKKAHYIVIESQFVKSKDIYRMGQHLISYFLIKTKNCGSNPLIIEIDPKLKTSMLNLPRMKQRLLKKKCKEIAINLLHERGEHDLAENIAKLRKGDDHGDTICYEYIWWKILSQNKKNLGLKKNKLKIINT